MTRSALEGFGKRLQSSDEVVVGATGNATAVVLVLAPKRSLLIWLISFPQPSSSVARATPNY
jgi:hypothetical protein